MSKGLTDQEMAMLKNKPVNNAQSAKKAPVKKTNKARVEGGQIQSFDGLVAQQAMITADKANHFMMQQAGQLNAVGDQLGDAIVELAVNAPNLIAAAALRRINQRVEEGYIGQQLSQSNCNGSIDGWQYDTTLNVDFNSTLQNCLTVGDRKPQLTATSQPI